MLKTNWAIQTSNKDFKVYRATLCALGYELSIPTQESSDMGIGFYLGLNSKWVNHTVQRSNDYNHTAEDTNYFNSIEEFLNFHFAEKTLQEIELDKLSQQLVELQAQIEVVKQSVKS